MELPSYTCDLCIRQKEETLGQLFLKCNFAKACWASIGLQVPAGRRPLQVFRIFKRSLGVSFYMEIIILMAWSIWKKRNDWIFQNADPQLWDAEQRPNTSHALKNG